MKFVSECCKKMGKTKKGGVKFHHLLLFIIIIIEFSYDRGNGKELN